MTEETMLKLMLVDMATREEFWKAPYGSDEEFSASHKRDKTRKEAKAAKDEFGLLWKEAKLAARAYRRMNKSCMNAESIAENCKRIVGYYYDRTASNDTLDEIKFKCSRKFELKREMMRKLYEFKSAELEYHNMYDRYMREYGC